MALQPLSPIAAAAAWPLVPRPNARLLSGRADTYNKGCYHTQSLFTCSSMLSWSSTVDYLRLRGGAGTFLSGHFANKHILKKRAGFLRCATIEEIEAERSLIEKDTKDRMEKTLESVRASFNAVRTGRANPSMLDRVEVDYYGSPVSLKSIAQISTPDGSSLLVQPYDKSSLKIIEKAIVSSDVGLTPNNDGEVIRLTIPQLTSERRKEFLKIVSKQSEEGKVMNEESCEASQY